MTSDLYWGGWWMTSDLYWGGWWMTSGGVVDDIRFWLDLDEARLIRVPGCARCHSEEREFILSLHAERTRSLPRKEKRQVGLRNGGVTPCDG